MTKKDIKKIKEGDIIYEYRWHYKVIRVYKSGVLAITSWKNWAGTFHEKVFFKYDKLLNDEYILI